MTEMVKSWLTGMYEAEIEEVRGTISNERLWMLGANTQDEVVMHSNNIQSHMEYLEILEEMVYNLNH